MTSPSGNSQVIDKLREFLRQLNPAARAMLSAGLERAALRGEAMPGGDLILRELRNTDSATERENGWLANACKLALAPLEPFLIDESRDIVVEGRLPRAIVTPLWDWISRDLLPAEAKTYSDEVARFANEAAKVGSVTYKFQEAMVQRIEVAIGALRADDRQRRRIVAQIGTPQALDDVQRIARILKQRSALSTLANRLPMRLRALDADQIESVKASIDATAGSDRDLLALALVVVMSRLPAPWQLIRLATKAAESDAPSRIAETAYAPAVAFVFADLERRVRALAVDLKRDIASIPPDSIKDIHDTVRGLRTEIDLSGDGSFGRRLGQIRGELANVLKPRIETLPARVRRLLQPRGPAEIAKSKIDAADVAEIEALLALTVTCRTHAAELAINEITLRAFSDLQQSIETNSESLLEGLRQSRPADKPFRLAQLDAAIRFAEKVFGVDYATLLAKAVDVAANAEPKPAAARA
jgi:hypothetical protein